MKRQSIVVAMIIFFGLPVRAEQPKSLFYLTRDPKSVRSFLAHADKIDILVPAWYSVDSNGLVSGGPNPLVLETARQHHVPIMPIVVNAVFSQEDFHTAILGPRSAGLPIQLTEDTLQSASEFALEIHLEEFIDKNWDNIDFGAKLSRYEMEDQDGRQFPAGPWSIDFLCTERGTGDFVVVELKRGKTSDAAVGQILRYISWVRKNMAKEGQKVKGIIIAKEVDEALGYAVRDLVDVSVSTYRVDFSLAPFKK